MQQPWDVNFQLERTHGTPLYRQVVGSVVERVGKGLLPPGTILPGTRSLAKVLGVHRNTVKAAYDELLASGWVNTAPSRGTFIAAAVPDRGKDPSSQSVTAEVRNGRSGIAVHREADKSASAAAIDVPAQLAYRRALICTDGSVDPRLAPTVEFARAFRRALRTQEGCGAQDWRGHAGLRASIAERLRSSRSMPVVADEILVTTGQRMSLYLIARALLPQGSTIAVEQPGNKAAWHAFAQCGLRIVGIPVDAKGIRTDWVANCAGIGAVYVTPACQYPTTVPLSPERRSRLLDWSRRTGALIIEEDLDSEFVFDGSPTIPMAAMDSRATVISVGSFSRIFSPEIEPGYVRASRAAIHRLARLRLAIGRNGDRLMEAALFELAAEGVLRRYLRRVRKIYRERRDRTALCFREEFGDRVKISIPAGGLAIWIELDPVIDTRAWAESALRLGVRFTSSSEYRLDHSPHGGIRVGFAALTNEELKTVAARLRRCLPERSQRYTKGIQQKDSQIRRCIA